MSDMNCFWCSERKDNWMCFDCTEKRFGNQSREAETIPPPEPTASLPPAHTVEYWQGIAQEMIETNQTLAALNKTLCERIFRQGILIAEYAGKGKWVKDG